MNRVSFSSWVLRAGLGLATLAALLIGAAPLFAQVDTGTILGTVTDASGGAVAGANVTLTNEGTSVTLTTTTGADGSYTFTPVRIGRYKVSASFQGFQTVERPHVVVNVGSDVVVNFDLRPGAVSQTIEVNAATPVLETQNASVGQVIDSRAVNDLPLNGRNFTFLAQLAPGVNSPQADTRGNAASGAFAANGLRPAQNNYLLDGIDNNSDTVDFLNGTNFVVLPPVDAIQEFRVETSNFSAEFGRSGAAVLNAQVKSGTNQFHGAVWEFLRNDKFDAADFFENAGGRPKGEYRQNQYGFTAGGPVIKNKIFFFGDYEGLNRRQGTVQTGAVPTLAESSSGFTNFKDLLNGQTCAAARKDLLGRCIDSGTILDPATTRAVTSGAADPVTGIVATGNGYVRDPFSTCAAGTTDFTASGCQANLNILPTNRLDPNVVKLLGLYPAPTSAGTSANFTNSPKLKEDRKAFDARMDFNFSDKNQLFYRFSFVDDPQLIPSIFGGVADGGGFAQGNQTANAQQSALVYTHTFNPSLINVARAGLNYLHTTRNIPAANDLSDIPGSFGVLGVPQVQENGGLPAFSIGGLQTLGGNSFLPSDEVTSTFQLTDDVTKIYGKHSFKMGIEWQHVKFSTLQPPWSRGQFDFGGQYTDIPTQNQGNTGIAQMLLTPIASKVAGGVNYVGGPEDVRVSNIALTDNGKNYYGTYFNDDWKVTKKLTVNLGLRWDFFGLVYEHHGAQASMVPGGPPTGGPMYLLPSNNRGAVNNLSPNFLSLLAKDGITLSDGKFGGKGLGTAQKTNFAPRLGIAYQVSPKLVVRAGWGMFYNGFENRGFSPNIGENYPFQFDFHFPIPDDAHPINTFAGCPTATPAGGPTFETGFSCTQLSPLLVNGAGLSLRGIQYDYLTPYTLESNLTVQYQLTSSLSAQVAYVGTNARHLEVFPSLNNPTKLLPANGNAQTVVPFPDFGRGASYAATEGNSNYNGLQFRLDKRFSNGLTFLFAYTWSKVLSDARDLLNGGSDRGYRAPGLPGFSIHNDYGLANFDIRNVIHFSGGYELPFGKGKRFLSGVGGVENQIIGGWQANWSATLQGGQPIGIGCINGTSAGFGCYALKVGDPQVGLHDTSTGHIAWIGNPKAFNQPCQLDASLNPIANSPAGCVAMPGVAALGGLGQPQIPGPGFHRLDFSLFKQFQITERYRLEFRSEFFNILNHPNFNAPGFGGNGVVAISNSLNWTNANFGRIGATRDAPIDPRQIQFALKFYY